ncbi:hypothetical protein C2E23DRAFT_588957 [Lenzites betulinus]|nr:hypothetical protein C2E23DRAFT_588957 [Lenzites betulinus]
MSLRNLISVELTLMSSAGPRLQEARLSQSRNMGGTTSFNSPSAVDLIPAVPGEDQYDRVYMKRPRKCALVRARDKYLVVQWRLRGIPRLFHPDSYRKVVCGGCGDPYENYLT